jgi:methionyl-tRNA formyltransferase
MLEDDKHTGITIMKMDEEMDHGSIIAQKNINIEEWPTYEEFEEMMAIMGAHLLENTLPKWINGDIREIEQDHSSATYTKKVTKEDGLIDIYDLKTDQYLNFRKIQAYHDWPQAYFFADRRGTRIRVKITEASFGDEKFTIKKVIPEGGKEMSYADFERGLK